VPQDYETIQSAIDASAVGDEVLVDKGSYQETLLIKSGVTLRGVDAKEVILEIGATAPNVITVIEADGVIVENLTVVDGLERTQAEVWTLGISLSDGKISELKEGTSGAECGLQVGDELLEFNGAPLRYSSDLEDAVALSEGAESYAIKVNRGGAELEFTLESRLMVDPGWYHSGIKLAVSTATIRNCQMSGFSGVGIYVNHCPEGVLIENNTMQENGLAGVFIDEGSVVQVLDNQCTENGRFGVSLMGESTGGAIAGNTCSGNGESGFYAYGVSGLSVEGNALEGNGYGLSLWSCKNATAEGNVCRGNGAIGMVVCGASEGIRLADNECAKNRSVGIAVTDPSTVVLENNACVENEQHGMYFVAGAQVEVMGNRCEKNVEEGIYIQDEATKVVLKENLLSENLSNGCILRAGATAEGEGNHFSSNSSNGLAVSGGSSYVGSKEVYADNTEQGLAIGGEGTRVESRGGVVSGNGSHGVGVNAGSVASFLSFECANNGKCGVIVVGTGSEASLSNSRLTGNGQAGFAAMKRASAVLTDNTCDENRSYGLFVDTGAKMKVDGISCKGNAGGGILVQNKDSEAVISNVSCLNNDGNGLGVQSSAHVTVSDCVLDANKKNGLYVDGSGTRVEVLSGQCNSNGEAGVAVFGKAEAELRKLHVEENTLSGLGVMSGSVVHAEGNSFSKNQECGVLTKGEGAQLSLIGNQCEENVQVGLMVNEKSTVHARENDFNKNKEAGIQVDGEGCIEAQGNRCNDNEGGGFIAEGSGCVLLSECEFRHDGLGGVIFVNAQGEVAVTRCVVSESKYGISVQEAEEKVVLRENRVEAHEDAGFLIYGVPSLSCYGNVIQDNGGFGAIFAQSAGKVENEYIVSNGKGGIGISEQSELRVIGCQLIENEGDGLFVREASRVFTGANKIARNRRHGLTLLGEGTYAEMDGDELCGNLPGTYKAGDSIQEEDDEEDEVGVAVLNKSKLVARGIHCRLFKDYGLIIRQEGSEAELSQSEFTDNLHSGIDINEGHMSQDGCDCSRNGFAGVVATDGSEVILKNGNYSGNQQLGIFLLRNADVTIRDSVVEENKRSGIQVQDSVIKAYGNEFRNHTEAGIAILEKSFSMDVQGNRFADNAVAHVYVDVDKEEGAEQGSILKQCGEIRKGNRFLDEDSPKVLDDLIRLINALKEEE